MATFFVTGRNYSADFIDILD